MITEVILIATILYSFKDSWLTSFVTISTECRHVGFTATVLFVIPPLFMLMHCNLTKQGQKVFQSTCASYKAIRARSSMLQFNKVWARIHERS